MHCVDFGIDGTPGFYGTCLHTGACKLVEIIQFDDRRTYSVQQYATGGRTVSNTNHYKDPSFDTTRCICESPTSYVKEHSTTERQEPRIRNSCRETSSTYTWFF